jgi:hypothetical protein
MTFFQLIEKFLDPILTTSYGEALLSVGLLLFTIILLGILKVSKTIIITCSVVVLLMLISFGWIPLWFVVLLAIFFIALILLSLRGGSTNV